MPVLYLTRFSLYTTEQTFVRPNCTESRAPERLKATIVNRLLVLPSDIWLAENTYQILPNNQTSGRN